MIGPKKLSTIRHELEHALAATGKDPVRWLEERMTAPRQQKAADSGGSEILDSLRRFLESPPREEPREQRASVKK